MDLDSWDKMPPRIDASCDVLYEVVRIRTDGLHMFGLNQKKQPYR